MCFKNQLQGKQKTGDVIVSGVTLTKKLTDKEFVKFIDDATEEAFKKGMTLEKYLGKLVDLVKKKQVTKQEVSNVIQGSRWKSTEC